MRRFRDLLVSWGPLGIFVLAIVESAGIPNPGGTDALLLVLTIAKPDDALLCAGLAIAGSLIGSLIFYEITRKGGEKFLARYTSSGRGAKFRAWFQRYGLVTVFVAALLPIPIMPFKVFAACAGAMGVSRTRYMLVLASARIPRYAGLAYLGAQLGENSSSWLKSHVWHLVGLAIAISISLYLLIRGAGRFRTDINSAEIQ
jgi:membrane protein YqaA with SNARE-associated domain